MVSGMDECLLAYTFSGWSILENKIKQLAEKNEYMRRFRRMFIGNASECFCDKQDRILIPPTLREYAELTRDIVLAGVTDHFEIWNRERWERERQIWREDQRNAEARNEIAKLGI
jgi:MraZ protein